MKKRILILGNNVEIGGVQKSLISLLQSINFDKYEVDLVLRSGGTFEKYVPSQVNLIAPPKFYKWIFIPKDKFINAFFHSLDFNLNSFRYVYYLFKGIVTRNMGKTRQHLLETCMHTLPTLNKSYDVAIDYTGKYKPLLIEKVNASKKISWVHSDYRVFRTDKEIDKKYYEKLDAIVTISQTNYDIFTSEFPKMHEKTHIMQNVSNKKMIQNMSMESTSKDYNFTGWKILDITRLDPNKGLDIAVRACRRLIDAGYNIKWYIIGEGAERKNLEKLIKEYELEKNFILLGLKSNPYPYMREADMIVHCSLFEGRSVAIDEAMLLAKPIILTNYPTAKDQIENNETGLICDISAESVFHAVVRLIENEKIRKNLTKNLQEFNLPVEKSMNKFYSLLEEI